MHLSYYAQNLNRGQDGIWYGEKNGIVSYPDNGNSDCFEIEDNSFWFKHRNTCIIELVKRFPPAKGKPIFDIGGGNGYVAKGLIDAGFEVAVVEPGLLGAKNAKKRGIKTVVCGSLQTVAFKSNTLPAIGIFDVIEHVEDDLSMIKHLFNLLTPGGFIYLTVPAYKCLWSFSDQEAGHFRRYTKSSILSILKICEFNIVFSSYLFSYLPLLIILKRKLQISRIAPRKRAKMDHIVQKKYQNLLAKMFLLAEKKWINKHYSIPFGSSCLICAQKESKQK